MSQSSSNTGTLKPNYNKHFPRSFLLNYGEALRNLPDDKILWRLEDWNCEWLLRPNIAISEMASTLKDNWDNIRPYKGTVFTEQFLEEIQNFVDPITDSLRRLDNKDRLVNEPPDADDVLEVLKAISDKPEIKDLFVDAFNTTGPILMMAIHVLVINCLLHNPDAFTNQSVRAPARENFKAVPKTPLPDAMVPLTCRK